ncbi:MAG TPA: hypothetical protein VK852_08570 [Desulfobacterales bacterium]|jgi:hypothetical protein|nr:hypothetical protein [Desulfobacterales bacterium]
MAKKRGKSVSFDAMVKYFMQTYQVPTKKDVDKLLERLDHLEKMIKAAGGSGRTRRPPAEKTSRAKAALSASDAVLEVIKAYKEGVGFGEIQEKTGFGEKKLRNIIFRLNKMDKIKRVGRGVYLAL